MNIVLLIMAVPANYLCEQVDAGSLPSIIVTAVVVYTLSVTMLVVRRSAGARNQVSANAETDWTEERRRAYLDIAQHYSLTPREKEIFVLLAQGYSYLRIEEEFVLSHNTVKGHIKHIYEKFGVGGKQELIDVVNDAIGWPLS